jgi:lambda family phage portal protein
MKRRFTAGLVGEGSWPRPKVLRDNAADAYDFDVETNSDLLSRWEVWAPIAGANGDSIYQLQRLGANHFFIDGGLLYRRVYIDADAGGKQLAVEPIELDHLDTSKDTDTPELRIVGGRQLNKYNKVVGYWLKPRHPAELATDSVYVDAADIIDLYDRNRASDVGGVSRLSPCAMNFYNVGAYRADTMKLARTALGYGIFVESEDPGSFFGEDGEEVDETGNQYDYITPGAVHYLRKGEKINIAKPENPGTQYEPFVRTELRAASVGAGMSYESVSNDGSQSNFSSSRQMLLFERAMLRYTFAIFVEKFYSRVYRWFVEHEMDFGKPKALKLPKYELNPHKYLRVSWSRPKTEWVDPLKDAKAGKEEVDMGINTLTDLCEVAGRDIEEVVATRKYEQKLFKVAGIKLGGEVTEDNTINNEEDNNGGVKDAE